MQAVSTGPGADGKRASHVRGEMDTLEKGELVID